MGKGKRGRKELTDEQRESIRRLAYDRSIVSGEEPEFVHQFYYNAARGLVEHCSNPGFGRLQALVNANTIGHVVQETPVGKSTKKGKKASNNRLNDRRN